MTGVDPENRELALSVVNSRHRGLLAEQRGFELPIYLCRQLREMSNMIAPVSLDFPGTGSVCGIGKGVDADGRAVSRGND
jgi:hypothetical protein